MKIQPLTSNLSLLDKSGGVLYSMVFVKKSAGDSPDAMIRKFSRKVMSEGIIQEMKKREFHLKPSLAKKYRKELARKFAKINAPR